VLVRISRLRRLRLAGLEQRLRWFLSRKYRRRGNAKPEPPEGDPRGRSGHVYDGDWALNGGGLSRDMVHIDDLSLDCLTGDYSKQERSHGYRSGTSFAFPLVAVVAALYISRAPGSVPSEVRRALLRGVDPIPGLRGKVATGGAP